MVYHVKPDDRTIDYIKTFALTATGSISGSIKEQDINDCRSTMYITIDNTKNNEDITNITGVIGFRSVEAPEVVKLLDYKCQPDDSLWEIAFIASNKDGFTYADAFDLINQSNFYRNTSIFIDMDRLLPSNHFHWDIIKSALINCQFRMKQGGKYMVKLPSSIQRKKKYDTKIDKSKF